MRWAVVVVGIQAYFVRPYRQLVFMISATLVIKHDRD